MRDRKTRSTSRVFLLPVYGYKTTIAAKLSPCSNLAVDSIAIALHAILIIHLWAGVTFDSFDTPRINTRYNTYVCQAVERSKPKANEVTDTNF